MCRDDKQGGSARKTAGRPLVSMRHESEQDNIGRELYIKRDGVDARVFSLKVPVEVLPVLTSKPSERDLFNKIVSDLEAGSAATLKRLKGMELIEAKQDITYQAINEWVKQMGY